MKDDTKMKRIAPGYYKTESGWTIEKNDYTTGPQWNLIAPQDGLVDAYYTKREAVEAMATAIESDWR